MVDGGIVFGGIVCRVEGFEEVGGIFRTLT